jgi:hypothetical protein
MSRFLLILGASLLLAPAAHARTLSFKGCTASHERNIKAALGWVVDHYGDISKNMGKRGLLAWPGKSKAKLKKKLAKKNLKFSCIQDKKRCKATKKGQLRGRTVPILHQRRIALCMNVLGDQADLASVIVHEAAHLVRLNAHRTKCAERCKRPRFSESAEQATLWAHTGTPYDGAACAASCR